MDNTANYMKYIPLQGQPCKLYMKYIPLHGQPCKLYEIHTLAKNLGKPTGNRLNISNI